MTRMTLMLAVIAVLGFVAIDRSLAGEPHVVSGDATSRFMALGISKAVVIDLSADVQDVLVVDKGIVDVVVRTKRRVYIIGQAPGQTNVYFFGVDGQQIDAFDIAVPRTSVPASLEDYPSPANVIMIYGPTGFTTFSCTPILCVDANKPGASQVPGTQNINVTGNSSSVSVTPK